MAFSTYLSFSGQAHEAMTACAAIFGATDVQMIPSHRCRAGRYHRDLRA